MKNNDSFLIKLVCSFCGKEFDSNELHNVCISCGKVLFAIYDMERAKEVLSRNSIENRKIWNIWRIKELMPVNNPHCRLTLGEGWTPILKLSNLGKKLGMREIYLKDEGKNPTGTFKCRGLCSAVSKGIELGVKEFVMSSAGNAGAALSAYSAQAGVNAHIFVPKNTPSFICKEIEVMNGNLIYVDGLINDANNEARVAIGKYGYFDVSTLKEPYRVEGKKTMGFELAEQLNWNLPDAIIYPTGGGTGIVGIWKAFDELESLGLIDEHRPRMISVQSSGCAPIVRAFTEGKKYADIWKYSNTFAAGLHIPEAIGDYLILDSIRESNGTALTVDDSEIKSAMFVLAKNEGIMVSPEAAATIAAVKKLKESRTIDPHDTIILFGTGSGFTTPDEWRDL